jgi:putative endonuclease
VPAVPGSYFVYFLTNRSGTLYVGVTNNLERRLYEHKLKLVDGFTKRYNIDRLVYFEETADVMAALGREKKVAPLESVNPEWRDLNKDWE